MPVLAWLEHDQYILSTVKVDVKSGAALLLATLKTHLDIQAFKICVEIHQAEQYILG